MFCLRVWIIPLALLINAAPIYVSLFLVGMYLDTRPCAYCSLLLLVLVMAIYDWRSNWFSIRTLPDTQAVSETASSFISGNGTVTEVLSETANLAIAVINGTGESLANAAMDTIKRRVVGGSAGSTVLASGLEWFRQFAEKKQFRIPCVDVNVRL